MYPNQYRVCYRVCYRDYVGIKNIHKQQMKKTDYSWIWVGALSGLTMGIFSSFYSKWQIDEFNKEYRETYKNGLQKLEARIAELKERAKT